VSLDGSGIVTLGGSGQPRKVSDFVQGPKNTLGIAMAIQAKCHAQMLGMRNFFHLIYPSVTFYATYTPIKMNGVIEICIVRYFVDASPWYWGTLAENAVIISVFFFRQDAIFVFIFAVVTISNWF